MGAKRSLLSLHTDLLRQAARKQFQKVTLCKPRRGPCQDRESQSLDVGLSLQDGKKHLQHSFPRPLCLVIHDCAADTLIEDMNTVQSKKGVAQCGGAHP